MRARPVIMMVTDHRRVGGVRERASPSPRGEASRFELDALVRAAARAARCGATLIQVRERGLEDGVLLELTAKIVQQSAAAGVRVLVNDRVDVALAAGADGVHLPANGVPPERVRPLAPPGFLIGRSVHGEDEAIDVARAGACDYLIFGSVFATASKPAGHAPAGPEALARVCDAVAVPVIAIGGITADRAGEVARAGAAGIAAIGLFAGDDEVGMRAAIERIEDAFAAG